MMGLVSSATMLVIGAGLAIDAHPAIPTSTSYPTPASDTNQKATWNSTTDISKNGTRVNIGNASDPVYIQNGTVVNGTRIDIYLYDPPVISETLGWVTDQIGSSPNGTFNVNYFENGYDLVSINSTFNRTRSLQKRTLDKGHRKGNEDTFFNGRKGYWISEHHFEEAERRPEEGGERIVLEVMDYRYQSQQVAMRMSVTPYQLDPYQFPGRSEQPTPFQRRPDPKTGRDEGGNSRRPDNAYLNRNLGIQIPPGIPEEDFYNAKKVQDEDAYEASRKPFFPGDPVPPRRHTLVGEEEQAYQRKITQVAPFNKPIYIYVINLPER